MKIFENATYNVLPISDFKLFSDMDGWEFPSKDSQHGRALIELADKALEEEIPQLYATKYMEFTRNGNRTNFQDDYYKRRIMLRALLLGEIILDNGKYLDKIVDIVWLILEETTWHVPAHNINRNGNPDISHQPLGYEYEGSISNIDLFSAETSALMSFVLYFLREKLDDVTPVIGQRMIYEIKRRGIQPYIDNRDLWWRGYDTARKPNNWNPWIASNVLTCTALTESELSVRKKIIELTMESMDAFVDGYPEDGGCNEGPGYWSHAGGTLFMALEIIYDMTGGTADFFKEKIVYNMLDYIRKVHLRKFRFTNFADCGAELFEKGMHTVIRMGERTENKYLYDFALSNTSSELVPEGHDLTYSVFKDVCYKLPEKTQFTPEKLDVLEALHVAVYRNSEGFTVAAKGGHNKESHNHNDVGQFIILNNDTPVIIDIGAPTYTRDVFSGNRYKVFPINGTWHSVPVVNGYAQKEGREYACDRFEVSEEKITIEYQSAYEKEANVKKCVREILLGKDEITVKETIDFAGDEAVFQYYTVDAPVKREGNVFIFANGVKITMPEGGEVVTVAVEDEKVVKSWNTTTLHKLMFKVAKSGTFEVRFER